MSCAKPLVRWTSTARCRCRFMTLLGNAKRGKDTLKQVIFSSQVRSIDYLSCLRKMAHSCKVAFPNRVIYHAHRRLIGPNRHQPELANNVTLSVAKGLSVSPGCHPERSEGSRSMGSEMLRCAQHDSAGPDCHTAA